MSLTTFTATAPLTDLIFGASLFFPPLFKAVLLGFFLWLLIHLYAARLVYSGDIWHLSLFVLCVGGALWLLSLG